MASTITLTGDWMISLGNRFQTTGTGNLGTYATNGIAVTAAQLGLGTIYSLVIDPAGGYLFEYVASTGKIKAYVHGGFASHTHDILVKGGQSAATTNVVQVAGTDTLGKEQATDRTIVGTASATKGGVVALASDGGGSPGAEVTASTNLAGVTFNWRAIGI